MAPKELCCSVPICIIQQVLLALKCMSNTESTRWNEDKSGWAGWRVGVDRGKDEQEESWQWMPGMNGDVELSSRPALFSATAQPALTGVSADTGSFAWVVSMRDTYTHSAYQLKFVQSPTTLSLIDLSGFIFFRSAQAKKTTFIFQVNLLNHSLVELNEKIDVAFLTNL